MVQNTLPFSSFEFILFFMLIVTSIIFDLKSSKYSEKTKKRALIKNLLSSIFWVALALLFNLYVFFKHGTQSGVEFLTGYLIEKSLSIDNLFVFIILFKEFNVPTELQHRTLFYGMFGALIFRLIMIFAGAELLVRFTWLIYLFGAFLIIAGYKALTSANHESPKMGRYLVEKIRAYFPVTSEFHGEHFFIKQGKRWAMTPLFLALIAIEFSDLVFAIDSIPAILSITQDTYIVLTSNIFAILGLRALYFAIQPLLELFQYLQYGIALILIFVGAKFLISPFWHISTVTSLFAIGSMITISIGASYFKK
ncbi:MAG: TerC/Alx family metal homeostasis membrane protein [Chlamydia sp.]